MTPAARIQAAIELLDAILVAARAGGAAADTILARGFAQRRYAGSKDRRAIRALVYAAIRLCGEPPASGRAAMLALARVQPELVALFDGSPHAPAPIAAGEPVAESAALPRWLAEAMAESGIGAVAQAALLERAPLDLRVNRLRAERDALLAELPGAEPINGLPDGLRLPPDSAIETTPAFTAGRIEVQDAGSQLVTAVAAAAPDMAVVDLCAGAGGKTLALAAAMANRGAILACDIDRARLQRLPPRAERAGATIAQTRLLDPGREAAALGDWTGRADLVFVDAPCSGTGTWRRNPEARWRITPERLARYAAMQRHVLALGAPLVRPGGTLVYVVCSLLNAEGALQVDAFLAEHPEWRAASPGVGTPRGAGARLDPASHGTDGFFVAKLVRPC